MSFDMVLPDGFALPPVPYLVILVVGFVLVAWGLWREDPTVTDRTVLALVPWMAMGGALHVLYVAAIAPGVIRPLLGTPAVYVVTAIVIGSVWIAAAKVRRHPDRLVGILGVGGLIVGVGIVLVAGSRTATIDPVPALAGLIGSVVVSAIVWVGVMRLIDDVPATAYWSSMAMVFGHVLDGISTAIGVDFVGAGERSPVPRAIMDLAGTLPVADAIGVGWAFVVVKLVVVVGVIWLFVPFVRETPRQAYLLLAGLAALGLGPGVHNLLLFTLTG